MAKRSRLEIIYDILRIIQENKNLIKITPLIRRSNVSSSKFKEYFDELIEKDFVRTIKTRDGKRIILTDKGFRYLEKYREIINFIDEFGL